MFAQMAAGVLGQQGAAATAFSDPSDVAGLQLWVDAGDLSATLSDADSLTSWADKSSNTYSLTPAATAPKFHTAVVNSLPVVRFNGGGVRDTSFVLADSTGGTATVFAVVDWRASNAGVFGNRFNLAPVGGWGTRLSGDTAGLTYFAGQTPNVTPSGLAAGFGVLMVRRDGLNTESTVGGATPATGAHSGYDSSTRAWHVGSNGNQDTGSSDIAEQVAYNTVLSDTDANNVANYLATKYALTWTDL